jgi:hypothetical protein
LLVVALAAGGPCARVYVVQPHFQAKAGALERNLLAHGSQADNEHALDRWGGIHGLTAEQP